MSFMKRRPVNYKKSNKVFRQKAARTNIKNVRRIAPRGGQVI